nr:MAG TPA: hypothetical protein [Crassvirales sp.]
MFGALKTYVVDTIEVLLTYISKSVGNSHTIDNGVSIGFEFPAAVNSLVFNNVYKTDST